MVLPERFSRNIRSALGCEANGPAPTRLTSPSGLPLQTEQLIQNQLFDRRFLRELGRACGSPELDQVGQPSVLKATSASAIVLLTKIPHE